MSANPPLLIISGFAHIVTGNSYVVAENSFAISAEGFFIMLPFSALLAPAVILFFNFSAEAHVLMIKKMKEAIVHDS